MLCDDCRELILQADGAFSTRESPSVVKRDVPAPEFRSSLQQRCYLCTRLHIQLGAAKWQQISSVLPETYQISFDKSAHCHPPSLILVRLGCKLTPLTTQRMTMDEKPGFGLASSYGYLQMAVLPRRLSLDESLSGAGLSKSHEAIWGTTSTSDPRVLDLIHDWLEMCTSSPSHARCRFRTRTPSSYPSRLIDVSPDATNDDLWRLVEVSSEGVRGPYMTLSHRWGTGTVKLQQATQELMLRGMSVGVLPGTYQDAVRVVRHLKVRYLWIDSICIFQDERLDIQKEATRMAEVYGHALCNISALSGRHDGLFCTRVPQLVHQDCVRLMPSAMTPLRQTYLINDLHLWRAELLHMPLSTRGWVLQEEILAPRTIYFGSRQVLWDCTDFRACETYPAMQHKTHPDSLPGLPEKECFLHDEELGPIASVLMAAERSPQAGHDDEAKTPIQSQQQLLEVWMRFLAHYSRRALTFPLDKILAIAGVSKLFGMALQDDFVAGLWRRHVIDCLLWYIRANTVAPRLDVYRAPSWSWASCEGYVIHAESFSTPWTVARALQVQCETVDGDEFGSVVSAQIQLQALCLQITGSNTGGWSAGHPTAKGKVPRLITYWDTTEDLTLLQESMVLGAVVRTTAYTLTDAPLGAGKKTLLAAQGILVTPVDPPCGGEAQAAVGEVLYRRIGYFALEDRKSGSLAPKWLPEGAGIFRTPRGPATTDESPDGLGFSFDEQGRYLSTLDVV